MDTTTKKLQEQCQYIADQLRDPEEWRKEYYQDSLEQNRFENGPEDVGAYEWLKDALDIRYIVGQDGKLISGQVLVAFGGPNIWVNFDDGEVVGYWGGDKVRVPFTDNLGVEDALEESYEATK